MTPALLARYAATDAELLDRFRIARDAAAFAELVRRHGPAVLAACRRLTHHSHDADDAFQAAFLVLARKADRVRAGEPLAAWLYGVAVRAARAASRRPRREVLVAAAPDVPARPPEPFDADAAAAVFEEVGRLPEWLRAAVVLCELEGRGRGDAARELGIPPGTLSSRLAAARKRLAARLAARGFAPAALAVLAPAAVITPVAASPSPAVVELARRASHALLARPARFLPLAAVAAVVVVGLVAAGSPARLPTAVAAPVVDQPAEQPRPVVKAPAGPNRIVVWRGGVLVALDPDGKNERTVAAEAPLLINTTMFAVSPDGTRAAIFKNRPGGEFEPPAKVKLFIRGFGTGAAVHPIDAAADEYTVRWSGDGTQLVVSVLTAGATAKDLRVTHFLYTPATKVRTPLEFPDRHVVIDWSRDGRSFLTLELGADDTTPPAGTWVMNRDGTPRKRLTAAGTSHKLARFSPDGGRVLAARFVAWADDEKENDRLEALGRNTRHARVMPEVIDAATGRATPLKDMPLDVDYYSSCWSPDGRRIAYTWRERHPLAADDAPRETQSHLTVCDADGGNQRTLFTDRGPTESHVVLAGVDWR